MDNSFKTTSRPKKLSTKTKIGYGSGFVAASLMGDFMSVYFLFFLTTSAGVKPALAGTIVLLATVANAVANPVIGVIADKPDKKGRPRKRALLMRSIIFTGISSFLLFSVLDVGPYAKAIYYGVLGVLFYFSYATYEVPFYAIAANLTNDPDDRTSLSAYTNVIAYLGSFILGMAIPILIDNFTTPESFGAKGWLIIIALIIVGSAISIFICWKSTAYTEEISMEEVSEEVVEEVDEEKLGIKGYLSIFKVKPLYVLHFQE